MATYYVDAAAGNDANLGTSPGAGNAWATLTKAANTVAAGDKVNVKVSGPYNEILTLVTSGTVTARIWWEGYTTTVGDLGQVTVEGGNVRATCLQLAAVTFNVFSNFIFQGATAQVVGWTGQADDNFFVGCKFLKGSAAAPVSFQPSSGFAAPVIGFVGCEIANFPGAGIPPNFDALIVTHCEVHGNGGDGISIRGFQSIDCITHCAIYGNTGNGITLAASTTCGPIARNSFSANGGSHIQIDGANNSFVTIDGNVFSGAGAWNVSIVNALSGSSGANATLIHTMRNFYTAGVSGHVSAPAKLIAPVLDVLLTASPFVAANNLSLNNTAGAGAAVRAAAYGNTWPSGNFTGYADAGAIQHQDAGGTTVIFVEDD